MAGMGCRPSSIEGVLLLSNITVAEMFHQADSRSMESPMRKALMGFNDRSFALLTLAVAPRGCG